LLVVMSCSLQVLIEKKLIFLDQFFDRIWDWS
jgi:hypothetical protein